MNNKKLGILLVIAGLLLLGLIIYFLFFLNFEQDIQTFTGGGGQNAESELSELGDEEEAPKKVIREITITQDKEAEPAGEADIKATELKKIAMSFTERFGSYSNHSDFSNISDLKIFMTESMQKWADNFIKTGRQSLGDTSVYQGVITKAITSEVKEYSLGEGRARILVKAQKTATNGDDDSSVSYEDMMIIFAKEEGQWLVDEAEWQ
ncbi:hypothetical protein GF382_02845 [Candidatus Falkowbacteria bacterium]|nr:hypothetical protein [Candidatus Falkowbacteria bacterium]